MAITLKVVEMAQSTAEREQWWSVPWSGLSSCVQVTRNTLRWTMKIIVYTYVSDSNHHVPSSDCLSPILLDKSSPHRDHKCSGQSCHVLACKWCHNPCRSNCFRKQVGNRIPAFRHPRKPNRLRSPRTGSWWFCEEGAGSDCYLQ